MSVHIPASTDAFATQPSSSTRVVRCPFHIPDPFPLNAEQRSSVTSARHHLRTHVFLYFPHFIFFSFYFFLTSFYFDGKKKRKKQNKNKERIASVPFTTQFETHLCHFVSTSAAFHASLVSPSSSPATLFLSFNVPLDQFTASHIVTPLSSFQHICSSVDCECHIARLQLYPYTDVFSTVIFCNPISLSFSLLLSFLFFFPLLSSSLFLVAYIVARHSHCY